MKELVPLLAPVVGVVVGWLLNELGQQFRARREDRKAVGRALAELLELHYRVAGFAEIFRLIEERVGPISMQMRHALTQMLEGVIGTGEELRKRYDEAVTMVSAIDPILGFRLRSRDAFPQFFSKIRAMALVDPQASSFWPEIEPLIDQNMRQSLEELILELAKYHGRVTQRDLKKRLRRPFEITPGVEQVLQLMTNLKETGRVTENVAPPAELVNMLWQVKAGASSGGSSSQGA